MNDLDRQLVRYYAINPAPTAIPADVQPSPLADWLVAMEAFVHAARSDRYEARRFAFPARTPTPGVTEAFNVNQLVVARFHRVVNQLWRPWRHNRLDMATSRPLPDAPGARVDHLFFVLELALRPNYAAHLELADRSDAVRECLRWAANTPIRAYRT